MLKNTLKLLQKSKTLTNLHRANFQTSAPQSEKWDLLTAVLIERKPVVSSELLDMEKEFKEYLSAVEFERSLKNDTEIKLETEKEQATQKKDLDDIEISSTMTTQDFIDACKEELAQFKFAARVTDPANLETTNRKLDKPLVFVLNQKVGDKNFFILPQAKRQDEETLRQTADRVLKDCGVSAQVFGNAPCGFYKYKYPKDMRKDGSLGAKVFIYFARYKSSEVDQKKDFKWLDKSELDAMLPETYKKSVLPVLFD